LLARIGVVDPERLDAYRASGGYQALRRAFELGREGVIREVLDSKLLGRGGAAFPAGRKWDAGARQPERPHYIICNADESEPGTFKDRVLMEGDPFALVEAMTIAAYATGCEQGFFYIRGEYPLAIERVQHAIDESRARGLLGDGILGQPFRFDIEVRKGAGAYICGEETAVFNSIEGFRGEPRNKPPFPVQAGLFGRPTVINNVDTLANVPFIMLEGGAAFAKIGTEQSTGSKLFCLCGSVAKPGVYGDLRRHAARPDHARGRCHTRSQRAVHSVRRSRRPVHPARRAGYSAHLRGRARGEGHVGLGRHHGVRRDGRHGRRAAPRGRVFPGRIVRPVRAVSRGHCEAGRGAAPVGGEQAAWQRGRRARAARRDRARDERRVDLRTRPDGLQRRGVGGQAMRDLQRTEDAMSHFVEITRPKRIVELTIDGQTVRVPEGTTILDACSALGTEIPTLCYLDTLHPVNVCRVCVVEVQNSRVLVPACSRKVEPDMVVSTNSERV